MNYFDWLERLRGWFPIPMRKERFRVKRWVLLEGNRYAVIAALLSVTFASILLLGRVWTFEMRVLFTETVAVQTMLTSFLGGIILLVSIVVTINSIIISHDLTSVSAQEDRVQGIMKFRQEVGAIAGTDANPTDPGSFLRAMAEAIKKQAYVLEEIDIGEGTTDGLDDDAQVFIKSVVETAEKLESSLGQPGGGEFGVLWLGLETDYGAMMNPLRRFTSRYGGQLSEDDTDDFDKLMKLFRMLATGREYFKTLYYSREISDLSRTLLIISLPCIIVTVWAILAVNAQVPEFWFLGLPPLLTFIAFTFTIALTPFIVLTAFMLRVATVTRRTASAGPFVL